MCGLFAIFVFTVSSKSAVYARKMPLINCMIAAFYNLLPSLCKLLASCEIFKWVSCVI